MYFVWISEQKTRKACTRARAHARTHTHTRNLNAIFTALLRNSDRLRQLHLKHTAFRQINTNTQFTRFSVHVSVCGTVRGRLCCAVTAFCEVFCIIHAVHVYQSNTLFVQLMHCYDSKCLYVTSRYVTYKYCNVKTFRIITVHWLDEYCV
jgi:hypothetical protein